MAKYDVNYACGHSGVVELFGKGDDRERKLKWYESVSCPECYKQEKREEEKAKGLILIIHVVPMPEDINKPFMLSFDGDSYSHKDEIKNLGYHWGGVAFMSALDFLSFNEPKQTWHKYVTLDQDELTKEIKAAEALGAKIEAKYTDLDIQMYASHKKSVEEKEAAKAKKLNEIVKPTVPEIIKGKKWNRKIYGKQGNYSIYPDGSKLTITDDQASMIQQYINDITEYDAKVKEINNT